jgi:hypothetical protein
MELELLRVDWSTGHQACAGDKCLRRGASMTLEAKEKDVLDPKEWCYSASDHKSQQWVSVRPFVRI